MSVFASIARLRGRSYKDRLLNPHDEFWDRWLGVRTFGYHPPTGKPTDLDWRVHYTPTPYSDIFRLLKLAGVGRGDVFVDLGAGMGRAVFAASWFGASQAIGVEVVQELCDRANQNYQKSGLSHRNIQFVSTPAQDYCNTDMSVCFMFHPFGESTLRKVVENIENGRDAKKFPKLRIIYVNPVFERVLEQTKWLECIGRLPATRSWPSTGARYNTSVWQSRQS